MLRQVTVQNQHKLLKYKKKEIRICTLNKNRLAEGMAEQTNTQHPNNAASRPENFSTSGLSQPGKTLQKRSGSDLP